MIKDFDAMRSMLLESLTLMMPYTPKPIVDNWAKFVIEQMKAHSFLYEVGVISQRQYEELVDQFAHECHSYQQNMDAYFAGTKGITPEDWRKTKAEAKGGLKTVIDRLGGKQ
jgi:hypothetical protein